MNNYYKLLTESFQDEVDVFSEGFVSDVKAKKEKYDNMKKEFSGINRGVVRGKTLEKRYGKARTQRTADEVLQDTADYLGVSVDELKKQQKSEIKRTNTQMRKKHINDAKNNITNGIKGTVSKFKRKKDPSQNAEIIKYYKSLLADVRTNKFKIVKMNSDKTEATFKTFSGDIISVDIISDKKDPNYKPPKKIIMDKINEEMEQETKSTGDADTDSDEN